MPATHAANPCSSKGTTEKLSAGTHLANLSACRTCECELMGISICPDNLPL